MYRSRVILRCFVSLVAAIGFLAMLTAMQLKRSWLGWGVAPMCFLPTVILAAVLAQRVDKQLKPAIWIGAPTIVSMALMVMFAFVLFSPAGDWWLDTPINSVAAIALLAAFTSIAFVFALRLLSQSPAR